MDKFFKIYVLCLSYEYNTCLNGSKELLSEIWSESDKGFILGRFLRNCAHSHGTTYGKFDITFSDHGP